MTERIVTDANGRKHITTEPAPVRQEQAHTDHPARHYDRTCAACQDDEYRCGGPDCDGNCCQPVQQERYWEGEAQRYAGNADFWRDKCKTLEAEVAALKPWATTPAATLGALAGKRMAELEAEIASSEKQVEILTDTLAESRKQNKALLEALEYHQAQTRPITSTMEAIEQAKGVLK